MNEAQRLWWVQAKSDFEIFELLRGEGVAACHSLHFLQMSTQKIAKASFWGRGFSYGFRPVCGTHQALDALSVAITSKKVNWILASAIGSMGSRLPIATKNTRR